MRILPSWSDRSPEMDGQRPPIVTLAMRPDGAHVVAAAGNRVLVFDAAMGDLIHSLKGHKDTVYCVTYSADSKRFASGGADKTVIIWTAKGEGILKYNHSDSIQCVEYNPTTGQLASVTSTDFGLWSSEQKNVAKHKLPSKGLCCSWTTDGLHLAIGMFNGQISIRSRAGEEKVLIRRTAPVWSLAWNPARDESTEVLCVGSWDQRLSFYHVSGRQVGRDRELTFDPCCVSYFANGEYLIVSGSDRKASLYTHDGIPLAPLAEGQDWIWAAKHRPRHQAFVMVSNDGCIQSFQITFSTVHSIYQEYYVTRDNMTDVLVQMLTSDKKLRISCRDYVKKVAIYKDRLAVQLSDKINVFELFTDDQGDLKYRIKERINRKLECSLLCVTSSNVVLCQDKRLTSYDFMGTKRREWAMESAIRYIKVVGGVPDREAFLVGLKSGAVLKLFVDNPFQVQLLKLSVTIRCLDISHSRTLLAVTDDNGLCQVINVQTKQVVCTEANVNAVAWNTDFDDVLCCSGNNILSIKTGDLPPYQQKMQGFVVGFKGNKVFCLHYSTMSTLDVPHSHALHRYVERREFQKAYDIACLGVTESDWRMLGMHAMSHVALDIARKAFIRIREVKLVELLNRVEMDRKVSGGGAGAAAGAAPTEDDALVLGDILAFQGKYHEAAKVLIKAGLDSRAMEMFCDLKMWEEARKVCSSEDHFKELLRRQARWAEDIGDSKEAAKLWLTAGDFSRAIRILGQLGNVDALIDVCRTLPKTDTAAITECGQYFRQHRATAFAIEAYEKIGDHRSLLMLHVEAQSWDNAFRLLERFPAFTSDVYLPYAAWLAMNDRFEEAQLAYIKASRPGEAVRMMEQLALNAVVTRRFNDAAAHLFKLSQGNALSADVVAAAAASGSGGKDADTSAVIPQRQRVALTEAEAAKEHAKRDVFLRKAELYYAYGMIYKFVTQPFTSHDLQCLFNAARYLIAMMADISDVPMNISKLDVLLALARLAETFEMYRLARQVYEKLQQHIVPLLLADQIEASTLIMRGRPFQDREDMLPICPRCGSHSAALTGSGDRCSVCVHPFVRSFHSFEVLPLVEFVIADGISDAEAERLLFSGGSRAKQLPGHNNLLPPSQSVPSSNQAAAAADVMTFNDDPDGSGADGGVPDLFNQQRFQMMIAGAGRVTQYQPIVCSADVIRRMTPESVFIVRRPGRGALFYRLVGQTAAVSVTLCANCNHFFHSDDYEFECLKTGACPFCRFKPNGPLGSTAASATSVKATS